MSDLHKVYPGQSLQIPASAYNAFVDAALDHRNRMATLKGDPWRAFAQNGIIRVRNDSAVPQIQFAVMGVTGPLIDPAQNEQGFRNTIALSCGVPTGDHAGRFVILAEPLAAGAMGYAYVAGVCPVRVHLGSSDDGVHSADIIAGQTSALKLSADGSAALLWREDATQGDVWAVVRLGGARAAAPLDFSFRCYLATRDPMEGETSPQPTVVVTRGYRQVIGGGYETVPEQPFDTGIGGSVYMTWTYSNDTSPGSWGALSYGTPPSEDAHTRVVVIATVSSGTLLQRHLGDVSVLDIIDRTACT